MDDAPELYILSLLARLAGPAGKLLSAELAAWANKNTRNLEEAWKRSKVDYQLHFNREVQRKLEELENGGIPPAQLREMLTDEFAFLLLVYQDDAFREPREERRRMLSYAAAGSFATHLSLGSKARVQRTIRELDPEDVLHLQSIHDIKDPPQPQLPAGYGPAPLDDKFLKEWYKHLDETRTARWARLGQREPSGQMLVTSGCVLKQDPDRTAISVGAVEVSILGIWVLMILEGYIRERGRDTEAN